MDSVDQYQAIPTGEPAERVQSTPSGGRKKLMYAIGAVLLIAGIVVVTTHATTERYTYGAPYVTRLTSAAHAPGIFNNYGHMNPVSVDHVRGYGHEYWSGQRRGFGLHARNPDGDDEYHIFKEYEKMRPVSVDHVPGYALHARHHGGHHDYGVDRDRNVVGREYYRRFDRMIQ